MLGRVIFKAKVELFVFRRYGCHTIITEIHPKQVKIQLINHIFSQMIFPRLLHALIEQFKYDLDQIRFFNKIMQSNIKKKYY